MMQQRVETTSCYGETNRTSPSFEMVVESDNKRDDETLIGYIDRPKQQSTFVS